MFHLYTFHFMKFDRKTFNPNLFYRIDKSCWKEACTITNSWCYVQVYLFLFSGCRVKCSKTHDKIFLVFGLIVPFIKWYQNVNICAYSKNITEGVYVRGKKVLSTHKKIWFLLLIFLIQVIKSCQCVNLRVNVSCMWWKSKLCLESGMFPWRSLHDSPISQHTVHSALFEGRSQ